MKSEPQANEKNNCINEPKTGIAPSILAAQTLKLAHEFGQPLDAFSWHGVVNGRPDAADAAMSLQFTEAAFGRLAQKILLQPIVR